MILVRLSKLMSERGISSRREADTYIERGLVLVDGNVVEQLGTKVSREVTITLKDQAKSFQSQKLTILLNKPIGYVSCQPEKDYEEALDLIRDENRDLKYKTKLRLPNKLIKFAVAGRLDINSKGLLVLTQDGRVAKTLIGEDGDVEKEYLVRISGDVTSDKLAQLRYGLRLDGRELKPARIDHMDAYFLRFTLKEGRKRQIRRACEQLGLTVVSIKRVRIGKVRLEALKEGCWRFLEQNEQF